VKTNLLKFNCCRKYRCRAYK